MPSLRDFFVTVPITSLKFWANIPTCFPNIFSVLSPLWILRMQRHAGKQGTCRCIPRSCIFAMIVMVRENYTMQKPYKKACARDIMYYTIKKWCNFTSRRWKPPLKPSPLLLTLFHPYKHQLLFNLCSPIVPFFSDLNKWKKVSNVLKLTNNFLCWHL